MMYPRIQSAYHKAEQHLGKPFAEEVVKHGQRYEHLLRGLGAAEAAGNRRKVREIQDLILRSYSAKLVCLVRSIRPEDLWTPEAIKQIAGLLDPRKNCGEKIGVRAEPKASGAGWRPISYSDPNARLYTGWCSISSTCAFRQTNSTTWSKAGGQSEHLIGSPSFPRMTNCRSSSWLMLKSVSGPCSTSE